MASATNHRKWARAYAAVCFTALATALVGCGVVTTDNGNSDADKVSENIALEAEAFQVQRSITATSGITGEILFTAEGRCSFEWPAGNRVDAICKYGPEEYRKHTFILGD